VLLQAEDSRSSSSMVAREAGATGAAIRHAAHQHHNSKMPAMVLMRIFTAAEGQQHLPEDGLQRWLIWLQVLQPALGWPHVAACC
jgi:hypothetical protein